MKKIIYYLLLFFAVLTTGYSQVIIGTGTDNQQLVPFNPYYDYSYSQTIYLAEEISSSAGDITSIGYYYQGITNIPNSQDITIYMGLTDKQKFSSATDYVPVTDLVKVYEGPIVTSSTAGWKTLVFNQVEKFNWDGTKNILIAVDENHPGGDPLANDGGATPTDKFYCTQVSSYRSIMTNSRPYSSSNDVPIDIDPLSPNKTHSTVSQVIAAYIPNILLGIAQTCSVPTELALTNIKTNSATVSWKIVDPLPTGTSEYFITENSHLNPIIPNKNTVATGTISNGVADNISGLKHSTSYKIWVRNRCSDTDQGNWSEVNLFTTLCDINTGIYVQNFNAISPIALPNCWKGFVTKIDGVSSATVVIGAVKTASLTGNGNALLMENRNSSGDYYIMAVSPELANMHEGNYRLKFSARVSSVTSGSDTYLEIGTVTLESDGTFSNYELVKDNIVLSTVLTEQEPIEFTAGLLTRNDNKRIAFRIGTSSPQQKFIYVDNIHWEPIPLCNDVSGVNVNDIQGTDVTIGWDIQGDTSTGDIVITEDLLIADPSGLTPILTNVPVPATLENLKENTTYRAWVRSNCGTNKGSYIGPITFTTNCAHRALIEENFDEKIDKSLPACWSKLIRGGASAGASVDTSTDSFTSAPNSARLSAGGSPGTYEIILVSPTLSNLNNGTHRVRFHSRGKLEFGTLSNNSDSGIFTTIEPIGEILDAGMTEHTIDVPATTDSHIAFRIVHEDDQISYIYKSAYIDNLIWEPIPPCVDVIKPTLNEISTDYAQIYWTPGGGEGSWHVTYSATNVLPTTPTFTTVTPVSDNLVGDGRIKTTINGLSASSTYYVWVRSNCDENSTTNLTNGRWIGPLAITTECNNVEGYSEDFNSVSNPDLPSCWSAIFSGGPGILSPYASIKTNDGKIRIDAQFSISDAKIILVGPNTRSLGELKQYRLKFDFENKYKILLEIGTLDGKLATSTFTPLKQLELTSASEPTQIIYFDDSSYSFNGIDNHIGIRLVPIAGQSSDVVLDNIVWEKTPSCLEVSGISVTSTTIDSAILSWIKGKTETAWQISVNPITADTPSTAAADLVTADTNTNFTLSNLNDSEQYKIWIRSKCSDTDFSGWSIPVIFNTECNAANLPFVENFEEISALNLPICGSTFEGKVNNDSGTEYNSAPWSIYFRNRAGFNSNTLRYAGTPSLGGNAWYFTKGINLEAGKSYAISYLYGSGVELDQASRLEVKFGTEPTVADMSTSVAKYESTGEFPNITYFPRSATADLRTFTVPTTGVYYFGFHAYSQPSFNSVYIDDIKIEINLSSDEFKTDFLRYYPNPVTDVLNISYISNITAVSVYNMLGQEVIRNKANGIGTINQIDMSQLNNGTYMVKISADNLTKTIKIIKQ